MSRLTELRQLAEAASPGPWHWSGYKSRRGIGGPYLATWISGQGRTTVMDFCRLGMRGAQARFNTTMRMVESVDLAVREVPFRDDVNDIDHPDARFIAAANPAVVLGLLEEIDRLRAVLLEMADQCETFTGPKRFNCLRNGRTMFARYGAEAACTPCIAAHTLGITA